MTAPMELWVFVSILAAGFQTLRFMLQKQLTQVALSASGATFARFLFAAPLALIIAVCYVALRGAALPDIGALFWIYVPLGALTQILATVCVVLLFKRRNFAVGITFKKTEVILTVVMGMVLLGEGVSAMGFGAILLGLTGVLVLSDMPDIKGGFAARLINPSAGIGLLSGIFFGICAVCYRAASLELDSADPLLRAGLTLTAVAWVQLIGLGLWLKWREAGEVMRVLRAWRKTSLVGLASTGGSLCWFIAFTEQNAAYVQAVGQVELIMSLAVSVLVFGERPSLRELLGLALVSLSVIWLVLYL